MMSQAIPRSADSLPKTADRFYLPELDVLRFFAFFAVFIWHVPLDNVAFYKNLGLLGSLGSAGAFGVDLFFTLSGYLITSLLLKERDETGDINLKAFYARRTLRIWPLYYFSIALAFLLTQLPASITSAPIIGNLFPPMRPTSYFFMAVFLFNFNFRNCLLSIPIPFMGHLWSISVEEQFYLFWPSFARWIPRRRIVLVPITMIAIACIVRASLTFDLDRLVWNNTFTHLDSIAVGILIALLPPLNLRPLLRLLLMLVGVASWMFAAGYCRIPHANDTLSISMGYPAIALGSGAFVLATLGTKSLNPSSVLVRCLIYLGKISYGLYVYSPIARNFAMVLLFRAISRTLVVAGLALWTPWVVYVLLAFALNVALAAASYRWLEAPFLRLKERFTRVPSRAV